MAGQQYDLVQAISASTKRDYIARVVEHDKGESASIAGQFGADYWDGDRRYGYGGYRYDGRWRPLAEELVRRYELHAGSRVLDVGCGKGYLLYELTQAMPGIEVHGLDISAYAIEHAKEEIRGNLVVGNAEQLPFPDKSFDFVVSLATLHNLRVGDLFTALGELERVRTGDAYVMVEAYRNEGEKANLLYWQLTCKSFYSDDDWAWVFRRAGYAGDYGFIYFT